MSKHKINCTRCGGSGFFAHVGTCFKCNGSGVEYLTDAQYKKYITKKESGTRFIMFNKRTGEIVPLLEKDEHRAEMESIKFNFDGSVHFAHKVRFDSQDYIAMTYNSEYARVFKALYQKLKARGDAQ